MKEKIVIAGATGFIGRWIIETFANDYDIIALTRKIIKPSLNTTVEWRNVDLYSISNTEKALKGADYAIYLVHSMQPSTRLNQSSFEDTDLLLADNFSRAAEKNKVKQIIYIGGIVPKNQHLSKHLSSRLEVEKILGSRNIPLTSIRAGIIIGPGGSSFKIITNLINNLPIMVCPKWTLSMNQPIDIFNVLEIVRKSLGKISCYDKIFEVGGESKMTYLNLIKITSELMGKKRHIFSIPFFSLNFSKWWVSLFSSSSSNFVSPLVDSLKYEMLPNQEDIKQFKLKLIPTEKSIKNALSMEAPKMQAFMAPKEEKNTVRSVQRIYNPSKKDAQWVANFYPIWLSKQFAQIIKSKFDSEYLSFEFLGIKFLELRLIKNRSALDRQLFYITGGLLTKRTELGWLEFRSLFDNEFIVVAIHEYVPRLPWYLYRYTQAKIHLYVMKLFENALAEKK